MAALRKSTLSAELLRVEAGAGPAFISFGRTAMPTASNQSPVPRRYGRTLAAPILVYAG
ncbi:MAG TPA: hypothetical protein VE567_03925 [Sphingomonas sp.]|nr:hypothetical protein [Sphingomonas sp.]